MGFFSRKKKDTVKGIHAILDGKTIDLAEVNDDMFSNKLLGEGIAIKPTSDIVVAPFDGEVTLVTETKHAIGLKNEDNLEVLIHIGLETVSLNGEGFETFCKVGDRVKAGDKLVKVDMNLLKSKNIDDTTMLVIVEPSGNSLTDIKTNEQVNAGKTLIIKDQ